MTFFCTTQKSIFWRTLNNIGPHCMGTKSSHFSIYIILCSTERLIYRSWMTWGIINNTRIWIFRWTTPLNQDVPREGSYPSRQLTARFWNRAKNTSTVLLCGLGGMITSKQNTIKSAKWPQCGLCVGVGVENICLRGRMCLAISCRNVFKTALRKIYRFVRTHSLIAESHICTQTSHTH